MSSIANLTETFEGHTAGQAIAEGATIWTTITGGGTATYYAVSTHNAAGTSTRSARVQITAQNLNLRSTITAKGLVWVRFWLRVVTVPGSNCAVLQFSGAADVTKVGDVQVVPGAGGTTWSLRLRDISTTTGAVSPSFNAGDWVRVAVKVNVGAASKVLRLKVYAGANVDNDTATFDTGDRPSSSALATVDSFHFGAISTDTAEFIFDDIAADDAVEPLIGVSGGTGIPALTEAFEGGTAGAAITTANSFVTQAPSGAGGAPTFAANPYAGVLAARVATVAQDILMQVDFPPQTSMWLKFALRIASGGLPPQPQGPVVRVAIMRWFNVGATSTTIGDLRLGSDGSLQIRDNATSVFTSTTLLTGGYYEIALKITPGSATGHQARIYAGTARGTATATEDSNGRAATASAQTQVNRINFGCLSNDTMTVNFDAFRADSASEPAGINPPGATLAIAATDLSNVEPFDPFSINALVTGGLAPYVIGIQQIGTPPVPLTQVSQVSYQGTAPATLGGVTSTFRWTVTDANSDTATDDSTVGTLSHDHWERRGGAWALPVRERNRTGGVWIGS